MDTEENQTQVSLGAHSPWKSLRDSHIPTARRLLYIFKTFARKEPSSAIASGYGFRLILRLEKTFSTDRREAVCPL